MELIRETLVQAKGWSSFDKVDNKVENQEYLEFAHKVARTFATKDGKEVLNALVDRYLVKSFSNSNDTNELLRKSGRADVIKQILAQIEISDNAK